MLVFDHVLARKTMTINRKVGCCLIFPDANWCSLAAICQVKAPKHSVTREMVMEVLRDHYEGTAYDLTKGMAAGPHGTPNRGPVKGITGQWERATWFSYVWFWLDVLKLKHLVYEKVNLIRSTSHNITTGIRFVNAWIWQYGRPILPICV